MITIIAHMSVPPDQVDTIRAAAPPFIASTRAEPGCVEFWLHRSVDDPGAFVWYENFRDQAAIDAHIASPHVGNWFALLDEIGATNEYALYERTGT